ncbi:uncharacterized protein LOC119432593 isoform X2 [Dermacentor silvarum]|uniref:uncharacterized protein LOC119432593 isoform X2 n=1 Tax=Dermacentor silvarum TaxID=543639 RepID=UPI0021008644|nr:uncharacterized protein LOC119432593 isoform X2 [Dermacentor silvarum]
MVTVTICLYILALAGSVSAIPIEDDPHYFNRQIASDMTGIAETLYAKRRTSSFDTIAPCFSMSKHQALGIAFLYNVSYLFPHRVLRSSYTFQDHVYQPEQDLLHPNKRFTYSGTTMPPAANKVDS